MKSRGEFRDLQIIVLGTVAYRGKFYIWQWKKYESYSSSPSILPSISFKSYINFLSWNNFWTGMDSYNDKTFLKILIISLLPEENISSMMYDAWLLNLSRMRVKYFKIYSTLWRFLIFDSISSV